MPADTRGISKPRPSFSCIACKQRKVRCTREQPICSNCVRMSDVCEYEHNAVSQINATQSHLKRKQPMSKNNNQSKSSKGPASQVGSWKEWPYQATPGSVDLKDNSADLATIRTFKVSGDTDVVVAPYSSQHGSNNRNNDYMSGMSDLNSCGLHGSQSGQDELTTGFFQSTFLTTTPADAHTGYHRAREPGDQRWSPNVASDDDLSARILKRRRKPREISTQPHGSTTGFSVLVPQI